MTTGSFTRSDLNQIHNVVQNVLSCYNQQLESKPTSTKDNTMKFYILITTIICTLLLYGCSGAEGNAIVHEEENIDATGGEQSVESGGSTSDGGSDSETGGSESTGGESSTGGTGGTGGDDGTGGNTGPCVPKTCEQIAFELTGKFPVPEPGTPGSACGVQNDGCPDGPLGGNILCDPCDSNFYKCGGDVSVIPGAGEVTYGTSEGTPSICAGGCFNHGINQGPRCGVNADYYVTCATCTENVISSTTRL